jgi:hypothetical protein
MSSQHPYANLDRTALNQMFGVIEPLEGFGTDVVTRRLWWQTGEYSNQG